MEPGFFTLRKNIEDNIQTGEISEGEEADQKASLINSFGMYWSRGEVDWSKSRPKLLGVQQEGAEPVDFSDQLGVYILYDGHRPIYVGRSIDRPIGKRLYEHTRDRLRGRWNRFSWFGIYLVTAHGKLEKAPLVSNPEAIISTLEAILIEIIEPSQNRRRGDDFNAIEYLQVEDPELAEKKNKIMLAHFLAKK